MRNLKVAIIGSSVGLRVRPPAQSSSSMNYGEKLQHLLAAANPDRLVLVENLSFSRALITEIEFNLDKYIRTFPELYVINIGAVDAPTREIPLWYANVLFKRNCHWLHRSFSFVYRSVISKYFRRLLVKLRRNRSWVSRSHFSRSMTNVIKTLQKETRAQIVVVGINAGNDRVEQQLPGTLERYRWYSEDLEILCEQLDVAFISVADLNSEDHFPDGVHYNEAGHRIVAERIANLVQ